MTPTMLDMPKKTNQVRLPGLLYGDISIIAAAFGLTVPEYVEQALRGAVQKDMPRAAEITKQRAEASKTKKVEAK